LLVSPKLDGGARLAITLKLLAEMCCRAVLIVELPYNFPRGIKLFLLHCIDNLKRRTK